MVFSIFVEPGTFPGRQSPTNLVLQKDDLEIHEWGVKVPFDQQHILVPWHRIVRIEER